MGRSCESDKESDKMLLQLEKECLDVYKRKVEHATKSRAQLLQSLSNAKLELSTLLSALVEKSFARIVSNYLAMFLCGEITGSLNHNDVPAVDESDLSLKKFEEYQYELHELQKERSDRLQKVFELVSNVRDLCAVLGMDFFSTVIEVHPSLNDSTGVQSKSIGNDTLARLANTVLTLKEDKKQRLHKLQELASQLIDLWNLMDTPQEAEVEVERHDQLKASRMNEIAFNIMWHLNVC